LIEKVQEELAKHQELSRTASAGKFKSGLADNSEQTTKLHTACHLLNQALREVLNDKEIFQRGSNITPERLRFDFNFDRKLTEEEKIKFMLARSLALINYSKMAKRLNFKHTKLFQKANTQFIS